MHDARTHTRYRGFAAIFVFLLALCCSGPLSAQSKFAERLPANTIAYWAWHGVGAVLPEAAKNHVLQLALDPKLAPVWESMSQSARQSAPGQQGMPGLGLGFPDIVSLLSNPLALGAVELPAKPAASAAGKEPQQHVGMFMVYDATGKAELIQKLKAANTQAGAWTSYDFHGTEVESRTMVTNADPKTGAKAATSTNTTYRAQAGNYFLISDQKPVIEDLIGRFGGNAQAASSLAERPEFQEAQKYIDSGAAMEFFFRVPDFSGWMTGGGKQGAQALASLHLEKIHAGAGSMSFAGEATEMRGAILGDTSADSPFDLAGESRAGFATEPLAGMGVSYSASRIDWAAGFQLLQGALAGSLDPKQAATVTMGEAMAQAFLGMPIEDALKLFTGEMASVASYSEDGMAQQVYAVAIQKPEAVLRILRAVGGKLIVSEDSAGTTTYLDVAYPYRDPVSGTQRKKFYYVSVSPGMMVVAPRKAMLRQAAGLLASPGATPTGVLANPGVEQLRKKLPEKLTALSAADLTQIPWDKIAANLETQAQQGPRVAPQTNTNATAAINPVAGLAQAATWLKLIPPDVISHHVQVSVGGWWKDANGVYFESYIQ